MKAFLALWKDADPDIPILKSAKAEYDRLVGRLESVLPSNRHGGSNPSLSAIHLRSLPITRATARWLADTRSPTAALRAEVGCPMAVRWNRSFSAWRALSCRMV
jgi:hypothetical protein